MKNKFIILATCAMIASAAFTGCGSNTDSTGVSEVAQESSRELSENSNPSPSDNTAEGNHDASEKENSVEANIKAALSAGKGSLDSPAGIYAVESEGNVLEGISYVLDDGQLYIVKEGSYEMSKDKITMEYAGGYEKTEFEISETEEGFNLKEGSMMVPLVYAEGTDGLTGSENFDGIYLMGGVGYKFSKDGSLIVIENSSYVVKDKTIIFGGNTEEWKAKDGKMIFSNNGEVVMTLVPKE